MNSVHFTVIIPTFNSALTILDCLKSVINQTFQDIEILIIDGLSSDNTLQISESFNDPRIRIFSEKDEGIYDAMNKGIKLARGEWLYFLGSDDALIDNDVLNDLKIRLSNTKAKVVYGNVRINGNCNWAKDGAIYDGCFDLAKVLEKNICHQAILYNKTFITSNNICFNNRYFSLADWDFNLRCFALTEFEYIDRIIAIFNAGGLSTLETVNNDPLFEDFLDNYLNYFKTTVFDKNINFIHSVFLKNLERKRKKYPTTNLLFKLKNILR